jgi:hypothetical protein
MLFNTAKEQAKINFQNQLNQVFPEINSEIKGEGISVCRGHGGISIFNGQSIIGEISLAWAKMGKLRIDGNMSDNESITVFRLLQNHGLAH